MHTLHYDLGMGDQFANDDYCPSTRCDDEATLWDNGESFYSACEGRPEGTGPTVLFTRKGGPEVLTPVGGLGQHQSAEPQRESTGQTGALQRRQRATERKLAQRRRKRATGIHAQVLEGVEVHEARAYARSMSIDDVDRCSAQMFFEKRLAAAQAPAAVGLGTRCQA